MQFFARRTRLDGPQCIRFSKKRIQKKIAAHPAAYDGRKLQLKYDAQHSKLQVKYALILCFFGEAYVLL